MFVAVLVRVDDGREQDGRGRPDCGTEDVHPQVLRRPADQRRAQRPRRVHRRPAHRPADQARQGDRAADRDRRVRTDQHVSCRGTQRDDQEQAGQKRFDRQSGSDARVRPGDAQVGRLREDQPQKSACEKGAGDL